MYMATKISVKKVYSFTFILLLIMEVMIPGGQVVFLPPLLIAIGSIKAESCIAEDRSARLSAPRHWCARHMEWKDIGQTY